MTVGESALAVRIAVTLPGEKLADSATRSVRQVRRFGERFQLDFHVRRNLHLTASTGRLRRPNPITVVVIREVFNVGYSIGLSITVILSSVVTRVAGVVGHVTDED